VVEEEMEFVMTDLPDGLEPTSILLEAIENIENLRENIQPLKERDLELKHAIK